MSESKDKKSRDASKSKGKDKEKEKDSKKSKEKKSKEKDNTASEPSSPVRKPSQIKIDDTESKDNLPITPPTLCPHHKQPLIYFCSSCQEPACNQCKLIGPHNNQLHNLQDIQLAFNIQSNIFQNLLRTTLIPKRDQLLAQIYRLNYRVEEIKKVRGYIERDVRTEFEGQLDTLRSTEANKHVILKHDLESLRRDIENIDKIIESFSEHTKEDLAPEVFLSKYVELRDSIQASLRRDFKRVVEVPANDFPNELAKRRKALGEFELYDNVSNFKDKVISELAAKSSDRIEQLKKEYDASASEEVEKWSSLTDEMADRLRQLKKICYYCGCELNGSNANTICKANRKEYYPLGFGYTLDVPEKSWHKTTRHFFGKPRNDLLRKGEEVKDTVEEEEALKKSPLKDRDARVPYQTFLEVILSKILKHCEEKDIELGKLIGSLDTNNTGEISFYSLSYILNEHCRLDPIEIEKLKEVVDPLNKNRARYADFIGLINDFQAQGQY